MQLLIFTSTLSILLSVFFFLPSPSPQFPNSIHQSVVFTPPPPLPTLPLPTPSSTTPLLLLLNISYPLAPVSTNPFRFDLDTAISSSANDLSFGPFCPNTTSFPFLRFSGDHPYSPGWEAYTLDLSALPISNTTDALFIYLSWLSTAIPSDVSVNISATLSQNSDILQQDVLSLSADFASNLGFRFPTSPFCASKLVPPAASFRLVSTTSFPFFQLFEEEFPASPEPSIEFLPDFTVEPTPDFFPEISPDFIPFSPAPDLTDDFPLFSDQVALFVNFTYQSTITDLESGLNFLDTQFGANCFDATSDLVFYSGNDFSNIGQERFSADVSEARQQGLWTDQLLITLTADWWRFFDPLGETIISLALVGPKGVIQQDVFPVFPGEGTNCFHRPVADVLVSHDPNTNAYSFTVTVEPMPSPDFLEESAAPSPEDFIIEPSPGVVDPFIPIFSSSVVLVVQFEWDTSSSTTPTDVEASIDYLSMVGGSGCSDSVIPFVQFSGNSFSFVGTETFVVSVEDAFNAVGIEALEIGLGAGWWATVPSNATATVSVSLVGPEGEIGDTATVDVFPSLWNGCPGRNVGQVKVSNEGGFSLEIAAEGPPSVDNAFQELEGEKWIRVNFGNVTGVGGGVSLGGDVIGRDCNFNLNTERLVLRSNLGIGEGELYAARVGEMMKRGLWKENVDVSLMGTIESGSGTVVVDLIDENGQVVESQTEGFDGRLNGEELFLPSCRNKVGRVRVSSESNGDLGIQLTVY